VILNILQKKRFFGILDHPVQLMKKVSLKLQPQHCHKFGEPRSRFLVDDPELAHSVLNSAKEGLNGMLEEIARMSAKV
jgi:hypothetical protein